jgi:hypothetical protein
MAEKRLGYEVNFRAPLGHLREYLRIVCFAAP